MVNEENCSGCMACIPACSQSAVSVDESGYIKTDRNRCVGCLKCVEACCFLARSASAKPYTPEALFRELMKDEVVFRTSGGGVTLSGGEPTQNIGFCHELLTLCKSAGLHTALETCGHASWVDFERIFDKVDLFLYDIKMIDPDKHRQWTGVSNALILDNAQRLAERGANIVVRVPLIPGVNDTREAFSAVARFAAGLDGVSELHILPFHQVGSSKYDMIGRTYALKDWEEESPDKAEACRLIAQAAGLRVSVGGTGFASGRTPHDR